MQHSATHCNTLEHTITHNTLQHTATHCNTLQLTAAHCNTLQHESYHDGDYYVEVLKTSTHMATHCSPLQPTAKHTATYTATHTAAYTATRAFLCGGADKESDPRVLGIPTIDFQLKLYSQWKKPWQIL